MATPKEIAVAKTRNDATAHRLSRNAFMAKYAQAMPIVRNTAAGIANAVIIYSLALLSHTPHKTDFIQPLPAFSRHLGSLVSHPLTKPILSFNV